MSFRIDKLSVLTSDGVSSPSAIEVVFVDDLAGAVDREPNLQFEPAAVARAVRLVEDFEALFPRGTLKFISNSMALVRFYAGHLRAAGLKNYSFTVIPAVSSER